MSKHEDYLEEIRTRTDEQSREDQESYYGEDDHHPPARAQAESECPRCVMAWVSDLYELGKGELGCIVHHAGRRFKMRGFPDPVSMEKGND